MYTLVIPGRAYAPKSHTALQYKETIREVAIGQIPKPLLGSISIRIVYCYSDTINRLDGDNLLKIICDSLKGIAYNDDSQIDTHHVDRVYMLSKRREMIENPPSTLFNYMDWYEDFVFIQLGRIE